MDDVILEEDLYSDEEVKESKFKKFFILALTIFLLVLFAAYTLINAAGIDVLSGLALSYKAEKINFSYYITEVLIPITYEQTYRSVTSEPCPPNSIIDLHSHPFRRCLPSDQDFNNFKLFKEKNPDALMVVMCEDNRFGIYE